MISSQRPWPLDHEAGQLDFILQLTFWSLTHTLYGTPCTQRKCPNIFSPQIHILVRYVIIIKPLTHLISCTSLCSTAFSIVRVGGYVKLSIINSRHFHISCWHVPVLNNGPLSPYGATAPSGPGPPHYRSFTTTLRHNILGRIPLDQWSARRRDIYLHNTQHSQQTKHPWTRRNSNPQPQQARDSRPIGNYDSESESFGVPKIGHAGLI